nr:FtsW/RodA/SpoVE family cell cycle protein [Tatlockia sp.]
AIALLVAFKATNPVHRLVAIGSMIFLVGQSLLNIGVASGALPTTGLPLPLVSYGGNSIIASLLIAGLLIRVARESSEGQVVSLPQRSGVNERSRF